MSVKVIDQCRICGSKELISVLDLGFQYMANLTITKDNKDNIPMEAYPLHVVRCMGRCGLVQLKHTFSSDDIYREYWYRSGVNQTMRDALKNVVASALQYVSMKQGDVVVDIGCNDGTLLSNYEDKSLIRIGFDPVENIRGDAEDFIRVVDYFNGENLRKVAESQKAKIITSIAMFYDLDDPNSFVTGIVDNLADDGVWIVQMADLPEMLRNNMFDQIIHEHLEYYHIRPFKYLVENHGLEIVNVEKNNINGSSYRFYLKKALGFTKSDSSCDNLKNMLSEEDSVGLNDENVYEKFRIGSEKVKHDLIAFIQEAKASGKKVFTYGASTKGNVILQYCGFTEKDIDCSADRNPMKWGGWTIGSNIPIISEEEARKMRPDYFLVLPYYFMSEILKREVRFLNNGGKFLIPIPNVHTLDRTALK